MVVHSSFFLQIYLYVNNCNLLTIMGYTIYYRYARDNTYCSPILLSGLENNNWTICTSLTYASTIQFTILHTHINIARKVGWYCEANFQVFHNSATRRDLIRSTMLCSIILYANDFAGTLNWFVANCIHRYCNRM